MIPPRRGVALRRRKRRFESCRGHKLWVRPVRKLRGPGRFSFSPWGPSPQTPALRAPCLRFHSGLVGGLTGSVFAVPIRPCRWAYGLRVCGSDPALSVGLFEFACTPFGALGFAILGLAAPAVW
jgi:hypothetical protein